MQRHWERLSRESAGVRRISMCARICLFVCVSHPPSDDVNAGLRVPDMMNAPMGQSQKTVRVRSLTKGCSDVPSARCLVRLRARTALHGPPHLLMLAIAPLQAL